MNEEPRLNLTPYTVLMAITAVLGILASEVASQIVSPQLQAWCSLFAIIIPAVMSILFVSSRVSDRARIVVNRMLIK